MELQATPETRQTRRHAPFAALPGIKEAVFAINELTLWTTGAKASPMPRPRSRNSAPSCRCPGPIPCRCRPRWATTWSAGPRAPYLVRAGTRTVPARMETPDYLMGIDSLDRVADVRPLVANDIGAVSIRLKDHIAFDAIGDNPATGAFIVIDSRTNATVAAGMIGHEILG